MKKRLLAFFLLTLSLNVSSSLNKDYFCPSLEPGTIYHSDDFIGDWRLVLVLFWGEKSLLLRQVMQLYPFINNQNQLLCRAYHREIGYVQAYSYADTNNCAFDKNGKGTMFYCN